MARQRRTEESGVIRAQVQNPEKIIQPDLNKIHAEMFKKPAKVENKQVTIQTATGAMKTKYYEVRTYPNGTIKRRIIKVVKHK